jgi:predicted alpha/beta hydrolase
VKSDEERIAALKSPDACETIITEHWGRRDNTAVVELALNRFKGYKLVIIGHSVGGKSRNLPSEIRPPNCIAA